MYVFPEDGPQFQPTVENWGGADREKRHEPNIIVRNLPSPFQYLSYCGTILGKFNTNSGDVFQ